MAFIHLRKQAFGWCQIFSPSLGFTKVQCITNSLIGRLLLIALKATLAVVLLFNMDVKRIYIKSTGSKFQVQGHDVPIDFANYVNASLEVNHQRMMALWTVGHQQYSTQLISKSTPFIQSTPVLAPCPDFYNCSEINLFPPQLGFIHNQVDTSGQDFFILYRHPFYHIHFSQWQDPAPFPLSLTSHHCRYLGCAGVIGAMICALSSETYEGTVLTVGIKAFIIVLITREHSL